MRRAPILAMVLIGCGSAGIPLTQADLRVRTVLHEKPSNRGGKMEIQVDALGDIEWTASDPAGKNLELYSSGRRSEDIGERTVTTMTWVYTGEPGQYVIDPVCVSWKRGDEEPRDTCSTALFLDMGVQYERPEMVDIAEPAAVWRLPHPAWFVAVGGVGGLLLGGLFLAIRSRPEPAMSSVADEPPDLAAIRRWTAIRNDTALDDNAKAKALSHIFRQYTEVTLHFPALKWTTTESITHLQGLTSFDPADLHRARKLLRATDLVKFADQTTEGAFFDEMDADLRAFIDSTKPHLWDRRDEPEVSGV